MISMAVMILYMEMILYIENPKESSKKQTKLISKHMKRCSASLAIREM